jgi:hypothetical protein
VVHPPCGHSQERPCDEQDEQNGHRDLHFERQSAHIARLPRSRAQHQGCCARAGQTDYSPFSSSVISETLALASPKSMAVLSL